MDQSSVPHERHDPHAEIDDLGFGEMLAQFVEQVFGCRLVIAG